MAVQIPGPNCLGSDCGPEARQIPCFAVSAQFPYQKSINNNNNDFVEFAVRIK